MVVKRIVFLAVALAGGIAFAGDTPFLRYDCSYGQPGDSQAFELQFHNDPSAETWDWSSPFKRTSMHFEKTSQDSVSVQIITGLPVVSYASPEKFQFTAPLVTDHFDFTVGINPLQVTGADVLNLLCTKLKPGE